MNLKGLSQPLVYRHFLIYKPYGYLSQLINNQDRRRNKKLLSELYDFPKGTMAVGRLDEKSEGLLILTTNGKLSTLIRTDKFEKEYFAQLDGDITEDAIVKLKEGLDIKQGDSAYLTKPAVVKKLSSEPALPERVRKIRDSRHGPTSWISITLREGKFRQVRKMTAAVGFPTLRLVRVRIGNTHLSEMQPGEVIEIDQINL
ncbi:MAG: pseudouridine synthase [Bacteroidota bacterium]